MEHEELINFLTQVQMNSRFACKALFPDLFYTPFSQEHKRIFDAIDSGHQKIAIAAPRGIGKTTIARAIAGREILLRGVQFVTFISNSATSAEMQTENLKVELLEQTVKKLFKDIRINDASDFEESFSKKTWVAYGNTLVLPRGAGQQIRGLNWRGHRPQLFIIDDLEDSEEVLNELNRQKLKNWFYSDLMKSVNRYKNDWRFIYIDTVKHQASLLTELLEASDWHGERISLCDDNYNSNFPEYMTTEEVKREVEIHREQGTLDVFYMEMMNNPNAIEDAVFKTSYFKYYKETDEDFIQDAKDLETAIIVDYAKTVKLHSAESAIICVSWNRRTHKIYIRDLRAEKLHPEELISGAIDMAIRWRARILAIEVTGLEEFITHPVKNALAAHKHPFVRTIDFVELRARKKKEERIAALAFYYRKGEIYHNGNVTGPLEAQLLSFPRARRFDAMDAEAYLIELMEEGERYFEGTEADDPDNIEEEYPKDDERVLEGWRCI